MPLKSCYSIFYLSHILKHILTIFFQGSESWSRGSSLRRKFKTKSASNSRLDQETDSTDFNKNITGERLSLAQPVSLAEI